MSRNIVETVLGALVLVVAIGFIVWAYGRSEAGDPGGYTLVAKFDRADGLDVGGDVRISGIKVGSIVGSTLDRQSFRAEVRFSVETGIELPADSSAAVVSSGLLGGRYLSVVPGGDEVVLKDGEEVKFTQSAVNLEDLLGKYIFSQGQGGAPSGQAQPPAPAAQPDPLQPLPQ